MGAAGLNSLRKDPPYPLYESMYRNNFSSSVYPIETIYPDSIRRSPVYTPSQRISKPYYDNSFPVKLIVKEDESDEYDQYDAR